MYSPDALLPEQLEPVECPHEVFYLWEYFLQINRRRGNNGFTRNPISETELQAWQQRHGIRLEGFENYAIDALEDVFMTQQSNQAKNKETQT